MHLQAFEERLLPGEGLGRACRGEYTSRFERWDELAGVRRKPWRNFEAAEAGGLDLFFPPELYPVTLHPLVVAKGEAAVRILLLQRLYDYLEFTTDLESLAVIPVATKISRGRSGLSLPDQMKADAFKIVTDEAWHAQFSDGFARQVARETRCPPLGAGGGTPPAFLSRLDELRQWLPHHLRGVESLIFAIVSETLISGILSDIPRDDRLPQSVRAVVRDHAEDEGRHHVYFRAVLRHLWPALTPDERRSIGPLVPSVVYAFLAPDFAQASRHLAGIGLAAPEIDQVIAESWPAQEVRTTLARAASPLVRYFQEAGALSDGRTLAAFHRAGLVAGESSSAAPARVPRECTI